MKGCQEYEISDYTIQYRNNEGEWVNCFSTVAGNVQNIHSHIFNPVTTNRLRVLTTKGSIAQPEIVCIQELEIYNLTGILDAKCKNNQYTRIKSYEFGGNSERRRI